MVSCLTKTQPPAKEKLFSIASLINLNTGMRGRVASDGGLDLAREHVFQNTSEHPKNTPSNGSRTGRRTPNPNVKNEDKRF